MASKQVRYGIVGLGRSGWGIHVAGLRDRKDSRIVAVADPSPDNQAQAQKELGARPYDSLTAMLKESKDIDVVVVATPSFCHGPDAKQILKAGKPVVVEKPMSMSLREADSMILAAKKARKKLFIHQNYRFNKAYTVLEDVVNSKVLGKLFMIKFQADSFSRRNDWQCLAKNGGGVLNNTAPHFIDQIVQLVGSPITKVLGDLRQIAAAGDTEDHVKAFMKAKNSCTVDLEISSCVNNALVSGLHWIIAGQYGTLTSDNGNITLRYFDPKKTKKLKVAKGLQAPGRQYGNDDKLPWQEKKLTTDDGTDVGNFYDNVYDVLRNRKKMRVTPESVREVMRVMGEIRKGTEFSGKIK